MIWDSFKMLFLRSPPAILLALLSLEVFLLSSWLFVAASICITAVVVFLLVFNQIRMVMRLNPSDILAKE